MGERNTETWGQFLCFQESESDKGLILSLDCITEIRMEKTWLVFNTVVLLVSHKSYWFSSFTCANPYVVLNTIEHFWREGLLVNAENSGIAGSKLRTRLGKEMLMEAHDAQATLAAAASDLHHQGEQLGDAFDGVDRINRDLGIAEGNLSNLESWLGRWRIRPVMTAPTSGTTEDEIVEYSILYALKPQDAQKPGYFSIWNKIITLSNSKHVEVLSFKPEEVTRITVPTPWELVIVRRLMGQPDVYACITSAKLIYVLRLLQPVYGRKLDYEDPQMHGHVERTSTKQRASSQQQKLQELISSATQMSQNHLQGTTAFDQDRPIGPQLQALHQSQGVTDAEADELSQVLRGLKSLATEIAPELDRQDQLLDQLTQEVSDASDRIGRDTKRINRLL
ncbi:synaptosomal-associated protein 47-like [Amphiura filiformis]|uniref:synaptosomal-associated protein 47-like n=1 Tax=Amphiura filiformis TaxID=82378 RepID=UPI003B217C2D